jgi:hypothetical protein
MHTASDVIVQFSAKTPPIAELKHFFEDVDWQSSEVFIKEAIPLKPHSLLTTVWVHLNQNGKSIGMARLPTTEKPAQCTCFYRGYYTAPRPRVWHPSS